MVVQTSWYQMEIPLQSWTATPTPETTLLGLRFCQMMHLAANVLSNMSWWEPRDEGVLLLLWSTVWSELEVCWLPNGWSTRYSSVMNLRKLSHHRLLMVHSQILTRIIWSPSGGVGGIWGSQIMERKLKGHYSSRYLGCDELISQVFTCHCFMLFTAYQCFTCWKCWKVSITNKAAIWQLTSCTESLVHIVLIDQPRKRIPGLLNFRWWWCKWCGAFTTGGQPAHPGVRGSNASCSQYHSCCQIMTQIQSWS